MPTLHLERGGVTFECRCGETIYLGSLYGTDHHVEAHGTGEVTVTPKFICMRCARVGYIKRAERTEDIRWKEGYSSEDIGQVIVPANPDIQPAAVDIDKTAPEPEPAPQPPIPDEPGPGPSPYIKDDGEPCQDCITSDAGRCWRHPLEEE